MKVLLIAMPFYGYEHRIKAEIERQGHQVDFMYDIENWPVLTRTLLKIRGIEKKDYDYQYQMSYLHKLRNDYDVVLVIVGRCLNVNFLNELRNKNPKAKFVLYLWDAIVNVQNFLKQCTKYDKIYSFDLGDCETNGFDFLPLFYCSECSLDNREKVYDIYSALGNYPDRIDIVNQILIKYSKYKLNFYIPVAKKDYFVNKIKNIFKNTGNTVSQYYRLKTLDFASNIVNMKKSTAILDVPHWSQKGLTMRTIESIGCGVKMITTNREITKYDFYNPNNILIIDKNNVIIPQSFLDTSYVKLSDDIYQKYSLKNWVMTILSD